MGIVQTAGDAYRRRSCLLRKSSNAQTISRGVETTAILDFSVYDYLYMGDTTNYKIVAAKSGRYVAVARALWPSTSNAQFEIFIGTQSLPYVAGETRSHQVGGVPMHACRVLEMDEGDSVHLRFYYYSVSATLSVQSFWLSLNEVG